MTASLLASASALLLLAISVLVLLKEGRQGRVALALGLLLLALVELFDGLALASPGRLMDYKRAVLLSLSLVPVTFLLYGMQLTARKAGASRALALLPLLAVTAPLTSVALLLPMDQFFSGLDPETGKFLLLGRIGYWYYLGLMILCTAALVNVESILGGTKGADRWRAKHEFLGVGAILAVLIFAFSQGLLYRAVNLRLLPVRSGVFAAAALLIAYSRLYRGRSASLTVSRQALYRSFTLVAVGLYLLVLGLVGLGLRRFQVSVTQDLAVFVAVLSGLAFLVLLLSEEIRRRLRVLLTKHFYAHKHDYREEWIGFSDALAACRGLPEVEAAIVERYQRTFGLGFCALYVAEGAGDAFALAPGAGRAGLPARVALTPGLLGYFAETGRVLDPRDGEYTPAPAERAFIEAGGAWLLVPLLAGERLAAFAVLGRQLVAERLTYEDFDLMKTLGRQAALSLSNVRLSEELAESRELAAIAKVSSFVVHDLKNLAYSFSLMLDNAEQYLGEPDFQRDMVKSLRATVVKMNDLIGKLRSFPGKLELHKAPEDLGRLALEVSREVQALRPDVRIAPELAPAPAPVDATEMRKVILNLLLNACEASQEGGRVVVSTAAARGEAVVSVRDEGCGMSESFVRNHLFKPFRTTKDKGLGIGLYQCRQIVEGHGGRIEVESEVGKGTLFSARMPAEGDGASAAGCNELSE